MLLAELRNNRRTAALAALVLVAVMVSAAPAAARATEATPGSIRIRLSDPGPALLAGERVAVHADVRAFYVARRWAPAFGQSAVQRALLARVFAAPSDGLDLDVVGAARAVRIARALDAARRAGQQDLVAARLADLDVALADVFLRYADALLGRNVDAARLYGMQWQPARRAGDPLGALQLALTQPRPAHAVVATLDRFAPAHPEYGALRDRLASLQHLLSAGWKPLRRPDSMAVGTRSVWVPALRERLVALGFASPAVDDPYRIDSTLVAAVSDYQSDHGLDVSGEPDSLTIVALNERPDDLVSTYALNLARWRWLPDDLGDRHVLVNLPAYTLEVRERLAGGTQTVLEMPAVIGMANAGTWTTPVMSDRIQQVVFAPAWYVPPSIAAATIYPAAQADSGTSLTARGFETYFNGARVDPTTLDWDTTTPAQLRFVQRPGPGNALGRVKFVMPNPYFILIHDTNKPWSFRSDDRAFSNGCIHAGDPVALAQYVLGSCGALGPQETASAYRSWVTRAVDLSEPLAVHLTYFTAWPAPDGRIRFFEDVYGHDAALARALGLAADEVLKTETGRKS